jgi:ribonucleoside-diphosphate reductase alpha chain
MKKRPDVLKGTTTKITTGCGALYCTLNKTGDEIYEMMLNIGKRGECQNILFYQLGVLWSVLCQSVATGEPVTKEKLKKTLKKHAIGVKCREGGCKIKEKDYLSCVDAVGQLTIEEMEASQPTIKK